MPRRPLVVFAFLVACRSSSSSSSSASTPPDASSGPFEGEIDLSMGAFSVTSKLKGNKSHFVFLRSNGRPMSELYVDGDTNKVYSPIKGHKYVELSIETLA